MREPSVLSAVAVAMVAAGGGRVGQAPQGGGRGGAAPPGRRLKRSGS